MRRYRGILRFVSMCNIAFIVGMFIGFIQPLIGNRLKGKRFEIFQGYSFVSGEYNDTSIKVIVNEKDYDIETMFEEVRDFHNTLNGEPDELEISLYNSREDYKLGNCVGSKTYYRE